jgi:hypothetical protein
MQVASCFQIAVPFVNLMGAIDDAAKLVAWGKYVASVLHIIFIESP